MPDPHVHPDPRPDFCRVPRTDGSVVRESNEFTPSAGRVEPELAGSTSQDGPERTHTEGEAPHARFRLRPFIRGDGCRWSARARHEPEHPEHAVPAEEPARPAAGRVAG